MKHDHTWKPPTQAEASMWHAYDILLDLLDKQPRKAVQFAAQIRALADRYTHLPKEAPMPIHSEYHTDLDRLTAELKELTDRHARLSRRRDTLQASLDQVGLKSDFMKIAATREELTVVINEIGEIDHLVAAKEAEIRPVEGRVAHINNLVQQARDLLASLPDLFNHPHRQHKPFLTDGHDQFLHFARRVDNARQVLRDYCNEEPVTVTIEI